MQQHDRVNLLRLIRRLESPSQTPSTSDSDSYAAWIAAKSQQQKVAHARKLWKGLAVDGETPELLDLDDRLDKLEKLAAESCDAHPPPPTPRTTFLESLSLPKPVIPPPPLSHVNPAAIVPEEVIPESHEEPIPLAPPESSLLPTTPGPRIPEFSFLLSHPPTAAASSTEAEAEFTLNAVQSELTDQLHALSHQLKLNALHFSDRLAADANVVTEAEEKLSGNLDRMKAERGRLRDYAGKASMTTWMVLGIVLTVVIAWMVMFVVMRIT